MIIECEDDIVTTNLSSYYYYPNCFDAVLLALLVIELTYFLFNTYEPLLVIFICYGRVDALFLLVGVASNVSADELLSLSVTVIYVERRLSEPTFPHPPPADVKILRLSIF